MASYVSPAIKDKFETLSIELKNIILERNVQLNKCRILLTCLKILSRRQKPKIH